MYFLADKSAQEQTKYSPIAARRYEELLLNGNLATCEVINLEILYSARSPKHYEDGAKLLHALPCLSVQNSTLRLAMTIQSKLAAIGQWRRDIPDLIIAAVALEHEAAVLHYDKDYEIIAEVTDLRHEWIIERGTGHGRGTSA
ncbi:PIN domain-containing protein [Nesterenkonia sphaerica]|uniref:PIN domain nuclease n=1 Tax=Nesterenkonia sphaerica TaxID=1804988 RepID=A0A5R9A3R6_9MICC|nr:PIN domain-containing protein [Nesterenkonia sphaerica]TLP72834.1 PIN domain nuclease [Nesterenkonia sphaerica]